jgi:hypothetical protein
MMTENKPGKPSGGSSYEQKSSGVRQPAVAINPNRVTPNVGPGVRQPKPPGK